MLALSWDDVDIERKQISVNKAAIHYQPEIIPIDLASKKRTIPIPNAILEAVDIASKEAQPRFVCPAANGKAMSSSAFNCAWTSYKKYLKAKAEECKDSTAAYVMIDHLSTGTLRNTYAIDRRIES